MELCVKGGLVLSILMSGKLGSCLHSFFVLSCVIVIMVLTSWWPTPVGEGG